MNRIWDPTKLAELTVGDEQRAQRAQTLHSLVTVLLSRLLVDWCAWNASISTINFLRLPDEVLEEIALVLAEEEDLGLFNDVASILNQNLSFGRKLVGWACQGFRSEEAVESNVDLFVLRDGDISGWNRRRGDLDDLRMAPCHFGRLFDSQRRLMSFCGERLRLTSDDSIELQFAIDIGLFEFDVGGSIHLGRHDCEREWVFGYH